MLEANLNRSAVLSAFFRNLKPGYNCIMTQNDASGIPIKIVTRTDGEILNIESLDPHQNPSHYVFYGENVYRYSP